MFSQKNLARKGLNQFETEQTSFCVACLKNVRNRAYKKDTMQLFQQNAFKNIVSIIFRPWCD